MSPAEPRRQPRTDYLVEEPVGDELVHRSSPEPREGAARQRHLYLVRQQARRRANRRHMLVSAGIGAVAAVSMGLVALHVLIAENQFRLDNLQQQASIQQENYEKLRLNVAQLESPSRIVSVAEGKLGMQQPGSITYLPATSAPPSGGSLTGAVNAGPGARSGSSASGGSVAGGSVTGGSVLGGSVLGGSVSAPQGDADWPTIKPFLSGSP